MSSSSAKSIMSRVVTLGESKYLIGSIPIAVVDDGRVSKRGEAVAVTVLDIESIGEHNPLAIKIASQALEETDDVMSRLFADRILFKAPRGTHPILQDTGDEPVLGVYFQEDLPCSGPYFLVDSKLYHAFKLYSDTHNAFMCGVTQASTGPSTFEEGPSAYVPVPSRHYFPKPSETLPLSGLRVAVKDIYDIQGVKTTAGSKAYAIMQEPALKTAQCIQRLIDLGAVVVGKTKTVQFASGMVAADWEDYPCPINARGDKHLDPECSSSGSGASLAAYEWLDFAIGSDTLGSMTGPSAACGVFGIRPSIGSLSSAGGLPVSVLLDTPGHFTRSLPLLLAIAKHWLIEDPAAPTDSAMTRTRTPSRFLIPTDCFTGYIDAKTLSMKKFCNEFPSTLKPDTKSIGDWWKLSQYNPDPSKSLEEFLATTVATIQLHDCYSNNLQFRKDYETKHGHSPKVDRLIQFKWDLGAKVTETDYETACLERAAFRKFLHNDVFTEGTVMLLPNGDYDVTYRDEPSIGDEGARRWQGFGFQNTAFSVLGGLPAVSVPVSERLYLSKLTKKMENQPVSMMVLGPPKSDLWLMEVIESVFAANDKPLEISTGSSMYRKDM